MKTDRFFLIALFAISLLFLNACNTQIDSSQKEQKQNLPSAHSGDVRASTDKKAIDRNRSYWPTNEWTFSAPEKVGMDAGRLLKAEKYIQESMTELDSFLVVKNGCIVFEKYYNGYNEKSLHNVKSVTKSVISALVGIAIDKKYISGIDQKLYKFYPEYFSEKTDPAKRQISIKHMLTMSAGFDWSTSGPIYSDFWLSKDWHKYVIDIKMVSKPGEIFNYNTGLTHLLSGILAKTSKMSTLEFAEKFLFKPVGITNVSWTADPNGYNIGGSELFLTPRDMARIGYLYLNNGYWDGKQIIPAEWIKETMIKQFKLDDMQADYGYLWSIRRAGGHDIFCAIGYGGQTILIVPDLDMVAVSTANLNQEAEGVRASFDLLEAIVIPAVRD